MYNTDKIELRKMSKNKTSNEISLEDVGIDVVKFIAAALVLMAHTGLLYTYSEVADFYFINSIFRWCVPFFFLCAGFYMQEKWRSLLKSIFRLIIMYFAWTIFYVIVYRMDISLDSILRYCVNGVVGTFWYFPALIIGLVFVFVLTGFLPDRISCLIVLGLYFIGIFGDFYANVPPLGEKIVTFFRGGYWQATIFKLSGCSLLIWLGKMLQKRERLIRTFVKKIPLNVYAIIIGALWFWVLIELHLYRVYDLGNNAWIMISVVPLSVTIFLCGLRFNSGNVQRGRMLRKMSVIIYVIHVFVMDFFPRSDCNSVIRFVMIYSISTLIALLIVTLGKKIKIFKYFY